LKRTLFIIFTILIISGIFLLISYGPAQGAPIPQGEKPTDIDQVIWTAIRQEIASRPEAFLFDAFDWELSQVTYSEDLSRAVAWLDPLDPVTGMTIATEPMAVLVTLSSGGSPALSTDWQVVFSDDETWKTTAPEVMALLPQELASEWNADIQNAKAPDAPLAALGGYRLPWAAGLTKTLVWSAEHTSCGEGYCIYAFDFADGTMFPLLASKGGTVQYAKDTCENGSTSCTNIFIIKDVSTSPTSYQIYYHLAQNTIPAPLHTIGAPVSQGQFIGNVDDTGYSSGHHLHFMVHTSTYPYWGPSVDITFRDVYINWDTATQGGRPRTQAGAAILGGDYQSSYTSQNFGAKPPTGGLTLPADKQTVISQTMTTAGWGFDDLGVTRMQLIAYFEGAWHEVGDALTNNPFTYNLNVCSVGIPTGPFNLALRAWDIEGNQSQVPLGIRHLVNAVDCQNQIYAPHMPESDEVVIFSGINFTGNYKTLGINSYNPSQLAPVLTNDTASVILGEDVQLRMYDGDGLSDRRETLTNSDRNLADNPINIDHISSASVQFRTIDDRELELFVDDSLDPHGPSSADPQAVDSITVAWRADGATKYQSRIFSGSLASEEECDGSGYLIARSPEWSIQPTWSIGSLVTGSYTWCVRGRITDKYNNQYFTDWEMESFPVTAGTLPSATTRNLPFIDNVESGTNEWTSSGLWQLIEDSWNASNHVWACVNDDGDYGDEVFGGGDLTSPPIQIPAGGATLRFNYRYETESDQVYWDQRWVQISQNGGRFQNLAQLSDDAMNTWLTSPAIDLTPYADSIVRIRFHFSTTDKYYNGEVDGWLVDDIRVTTPAPQGCEESSNNTPATALTITRGEELTGTICPAGDVDYYRFPAAEGDKLIALVRALQLDPASQLDTHLSLLDQTKYGNSPIAVNDDMQPGSMTDSQIFMVIPETSQSLPLLDYYYLKVKASDHPTSGGSNYFYTISLTEQPETEDLVAPGLSMLYPTTGDGVPSGSTTFSAQAEDDNSGVSRVDFWWHAPDWNENTWSLLASDAYGEDGWQAGFDGSGYSEGQSGALAVIAYDWEDNPRVVVDWDVSIDSTPPVTSLNTLPGTTGGTGVLLSWTASDARSRLAAFDIQYQMDGGSWQTWLTDIPGTQKSTWFIGQPGHTYAFRMRGRDMPGNLEVFPASAEVLTQTLAGCTIDSFDQGAGDSQSAQAVPLQPDTFQTHNYCGAGDVDWTGFFAQAGQEYLIWVLPLSGSPAGGSLDLYQASEDGWLLHAEAATYSTPLTIRWVAPVDGLYLIRLAPLDGGIVGNNTGYRIRVGGGWWLQFPAIVVQ
jgi:murein DD-endopeptidase MepM/ murein hydrolase activator NlpD